MNSKEALEILFASYNFDGNYHDLIIAREKLEQDLDRLEQLEKERQEIETRLSSNETNTFDEIATMIKKANGYDVLVNKCKQLEKENQELKEKNKKWQQLFGCDLCEALGREMLKQENIKLKKALDILKENFPIKFLGYNKYGAKPYEIMFNGRIMGFDKEKYELLKEVFGDDK